MYINKKAPVLLVAALLGLLGPSAFTQDQKSGVKTPESSGGKAPEAVSGKLVSKQTAFPENSTKIPGIEVKFGGPVPILPECKTPPICCGQWGEIRKVLGITKLSDLLIRIDAMGPAGTLKSVRLELYSDDKRVFSTRASDELSSSLKTGAGASCTLALDAEGVQSGSKFLTDSTFIALRDELNGKSFSGSKIFLLPVVVKK